jgi:hypothetical protein
MKSFQPLPRPRQTKHNEKAPCPKLFFAMRKPASDRTPDHAGIPSINRNSLSVIHVQGNLQHIQTGIASFTLV